LDNWNRFLQVRSLTLSQFISIAGSRHTTKKNFVTAAIFEYTIVYMRASLGAAIMIAIFVYKQNQKVK